MPFWELIYIFQVTVRALTVQTAEGIVVVHLLHRARGIAHHTVVTLMVLQIVMVYGCTAIEGDIAAIDQNLLQYVILIYHVTAIVRRLGCCRGRRLITGS